MSTYSVLIATYIKDCPEKLQRALESILENDFKLDEIVLVCDGPITSSQERLIDIFSDKVKSQSIIFKKISLEKNKGLPSALNEGLKNTSADWVFRMDSDDICTPTRFSDQIKFQQETKADIIGGRIAEFEGQYTKSNCSLERKIPIGKIKLGMKSILRNPFNHMTVMYKRNDILKIGGYREYKNFEDYELWIRALNNGLQLANIDKVVCYVDTDALIQRRSGVNYLKSELKLYKDLALNYNNPGLYISVGVIRSILRILPRKIFEFIYLSCTRKKISI